MHAGIKQKWRPKLSFVVMLVLGLVLLLPFASLLLVKFFANQLVQQTEESLLGQASVLAASYAAQYGGDIPEHDPVFPSLSLSDDPILPPRPDGVPVQLPDDPRYLAIGAQLTKVTVAAQNRTWVGYRILDAQGVVIGGTAEIGLSFSHVFEVGAALASDTTTVARIRVRNEFQPAIYALSSGTRLRVFVAMPVITDGQVIGVVYLSRTPNHIFRFLFGERFNLIKALAFILLGTALIGFVFWRFITRPIHSLITQTRAFGETGKTAPAEKTRFGTKEVETLSRSFVEMADKLENRQNTVNTFTAHVSHELKSPLTSVRGAAELLRDTDMTDQQRQTFLNNILSDTTRMEALLKAMRELAQAEQPVPVGISTVHQALPAITQRFANLEILTKGTQVELPLSVDNLQIILGHMLENAQNHAASTIELRTHETAEKTCLTVQDNGTGISDGNAEKVMAPFFTTRRDTGGTGMGLSIVKAMVKTAGGEITLQQGKKGAVFVICFG